jgi:hypothetical protein
VLEKVLQGKIDQIFGGSVAKHTYVDGPQRYRSWKRRSPGCVERTH